MNVSMSPAGTPERGPAGEWPRAVLFDLDGTLVDTGPDIAAAVNRMLVAMGRETYSLDRVLEWVGEGAPRLVQRALVGGTDNRRPPEEELERGLALFYEHYSARICVHSKPYPHARRVLDTLRASGIRTGCVTNKPEGLSRQLLDALALTPMFDVIVGGDTLELKKPRPEPIHHACRMLEVTPEDAAYVGDSMTDCRAAAAANVAMIVVTYGYSRSADLTKAPCAAMIDSLGDLAEALTDTRKSPTN